MSLHRNTKGFVYIAYNKAMKGLVKIGATTKNPEYRIKMISNQSVPFKFELVASFSAVDCLGFEQYVHSNLRGKNVAKEFFKMNKKESVKLVEILASTFQKGAEIVKNG